MSVATTSRMAYAAHCAEGKLPAQQQRIIDALRCGLGYSRRELVEVTGIELSSVCGRVNELLKVGLLVELPTRACTVTGRSVHPVALADAPSASPV